MKNLYLVLVVVFVAIILLRFIQLEFLSLDFHTTRGISLIQEKKYEQAMALFTEAEKNFPCPNDFNVHLWLGRCYCDLKQYERSVQEYDTAIKIYNKIPSIINAESHDRITCFIKGVSAKNLASVYLCRGFSYMALNNYNKAVADFTESIGVFQLKNIFYIPFLVVPGGGYARYLRSICYYALGQPVLAEKDLEQLKKGGYWTYLIEGSRPNSSNWYQLIQASISKPPVSP